MSCSNCSPSQQTLIQTIGSGIKGITKVALRIDIAEKVIIDKRRNECRQCEYATRNTDPKYVKFNGLTSSSICKLCKCNIKMKTQLKTERCPENKWKE